MIFVAVIISSLGCPSINDKFAVKYSLSVIVTDAISQNKDDKFPDDIIELFKPSIPDCVDDSFFIAEPSNISRIGSKENIKSIDVDFGKCTNAKSFENAIVYYFTKKDENLIGKAFTENNEETDNQDEFVNNFLKVTGKRDKIFFYRRNAKTDSLKNQKIFSDVNILKQSIANYLCENRNSNIVVIYNPIEESEKAENLTSPKKNEDIKTIVPQKSKIKIPKGTSQEFVEDECANLSLERIEIQHNGDSKDFTWQNIKCSEKILFSIKPKNGGQGQVFTETLNGDASSFTCPKSGSGEISNKKHIVTIQAFDKNNKLIAKGERNDCYITCQ